MFAGCHISHIADVSWGGVGTCFVYFAGFYQTWSLLNHYFARFVNDDWFHMMLIFFHVCWPRECASAWLSIVRNGHTQMCGVLLMNTSIDAEADDEFKQHRAFAVGFCVARLPVMVMHLLVAWYVVHCALFRASRAR